MNKNSITEFYNEQQYKDNTLVIMCYIIDICNFRCKYCCNNFPRQNNYIDIFKLLSYIDNCHYTFNRNINITLLGGEPTLHPKILELCKELSKRQYVNFTVLSNLSSDISLYKNILELNGNMLFSWHSENKNFIQKLDTLLNTSADYRKQIFVALMLESIAYDEVKLIAKKLTDMEIIFSLTYICKPYTHNTNYDYTYTAEQLDYYYSINDLQSKTAQYKNFVANEKNKHNVIRLNEFFTPMHTINNFKMYKCNAGLDELYIHSDGKVYPCEDTYRQTRKHIGTIDKFDKEIFKTRCCKFDICSCPYYSKKSKIINI